MQYNTFLIIYFIMLAPLSFRGVAKSRGVSLGFFVTFFCQEKKVSKAINL